MITCTFCGRMYSNKQNVQRHEVTCSSRVIQTERELKYEQQISYLQEQVSKYEQDVYHLRALIQTNRVEECLVALYIGLREVNDCVKKVLEQNNNLLEQFKSPALDINDIVQQPTCQQTLPIGYTFQDNTLDDDIINQFLM